MVITILTMGSRGDVQPYIALGVALKRAGHHVRIATFENFASFVTGFGLEFVRVRGDVVKVAAQVSGQDSMKADNPLKLLLSFNQLKKYVFDLQQDLFQACAGSDAIVYHPGVTIGYFAARQMNVPSILATPFPMTPTRTYPSLIFYDKPRLGRQYNLITHRIFEQIMWMASSSPVKQFWKKEFGRVPVDFRCPFPKQTTRRLPTIVSGSQHVFPRPADWPEHVYSDGYWFLDDDAGWTPPDALLDFLEGGPAPIYVGFGSIGDPRAAAQTTELVISALQKCGQRGVLATGWTGMARVDPVPEGIFFLESAPHSWLFPRMAAVVHHGGAGTTAAGLRAGVPAVIIPHGNDQFAWGRRVFELGVGARPIPRKSLSVEALQDSIGSAMTVVVQSTARELGRKIQAENGAENAARIIIAAVEESNWNRG